MLSTFRVNTTLDTVAIDLRTGKDSTGHISLRSAIMAADAAGGSSTIKLRNGTYQLTVAGASEDSSAKGDLDLAGNITIKGSGSRRTIIDGNNLDRVIHVLSGDVKISGVTIERGLASSGAGLLNSGGRVALSSVVIASNRAVGVQAAEEKSPSAVASAVSGIVGTNGTSGVGGGVYNAAGSLSISNSTIVANQAAGREGGRGSDGASVVGASIPGKENVMGGRGGDGAAGGAGFGGGIYNAAGASLTLSGTILSSNTALGGRGGQGGAGGDGIGGAGSAGGAIPPISGGTGNGGFAGNGGAGGAAEGGGLFNLGRVLLQGSTSTFRLNIATGGAGGTGGSGGNGVGGAGGSSGGDGASGAGGGIGDALFGGAGGRAGNGAGGGVYNGGGGVFTSSAAVKVLANQANGGNAGNGGIGGNGSGGTGGAGDYTGAGGRGGPGLGGGGGSPIYKGGEGSGGGVFNAIGGTIVFRAFNQSATTSASLFSANQATGGAGGDGGLSLMGAGGLGGLGGLKGTGGTGGTGGDVGNGLGTEGSAGGAGNGGGLANAGTASFTGTTVNFQSNVASGGAGGNGSAGAVAAGGRGGDGAVGGKGGGASGAPSGDGGIGGIGSGGAIWIDRFATLTIDPRLGVKKRSRQFRANDLITGNEARLGSGGAGGRVAGATVGGGGTPNGSPGSEIFLGKAGTAGAPGAGMGGGVIRYTNSNVNLANTNINRNKASTSGNDMSFAKELDHEL